VLPERDAAARARQLIEARQYVLEGRRATSRRAENAFSRVTFVGGLRGLAKASHGFVYGDFRRVHRMGLTACHYRAAEWHHKDIELATHELLQLLDSTSA
jgi:hypothetical protein